MHVYIPAVRTSTRHASQQNKADYQLIVYAAH